MTHDMRQIYQLIDAFLSIFATLRVTKEEQNGVLGVEPLGEGVGGNRVPP